MTPYKTYIGIVPHSFHHMDYLDKLYNYLKQRNIEVIYFFYFNKKMINYCIKNNKKYYVIDNIILKKLRLILKPYILLKFSRNIVRIIKNNNIKLIILTKDSNTYYNLIVKAAIKCRIYSLLIQPTIIVPEHYLNLIRLKNINSIIKKNTLKSILKNIVKKVFNKIYNPILKKLGLLYNGNILFGQGNAQILAVINKYSRDLLVEYKVKKIIRITGSLHYDDSLKVIKKDKTKILDKYNLKKNGKRFVLFISQPLYTRNITHLSLNDYLKHIQKIFNELKEFYNKKNEKFIFLIKIHPLENIDDYKKFFIDQNIKIFQKADNYELIKISDLCIGFYSTVLQNAIIIGKPVISLNIFNLDIIRIGKNVIGLKKTINSWEKFHKILEEIHQNKYNLLENINSDMIIKDGKCYQRTIKLIENIINISNKRNRNTQ